MAAISEVKVKETVKVQTSIGRFVLGIVLSVLGGAMLLLSFPPYGMWPLVWGGFVPFLVAQYRLLPKKWSSLGIATALLVWLGVFLGRLMGTEVGWFFTLMGVWIALINFFTAKSRNFHELTGYRWFIFQGVLDWVGFEMVRSFIPLIATSGFVGYTQATQPWITQPVSIFSIYGLDLLIMLVNFTVAQIIMAWIDQKCQFEDIVKVNTRATRNWGIGVGIALAAWIGLSLFLLNSAPADAPTVRVAAVQPNFELAAMQDAETPQQTRVDYFTNKARGAAQNGAQVIFSSEMMFNFDPQVEYTKEFQALAQETGAYLFIAYVVTDPEWRNEAVVVAPSGEFLDVYGKNHVFGEPPTPTSGVFPVYETPFGTFATLICHDANSTDIARYLTGNGAQLIGAPLNEFGGFGEQYWTNVTFRAIENRAAMVVTGRQAGSAIIDPYGRQLALETNLEGTEVTLMADVPLAKSGTVYTSLGDLLGWVSLAGLIGMMVFQSQTEKKAKKSE